MNREFTYTVSENENNYSAGDFLRKKGVSRRLITKLKQIDNGISCNGSHIRTVDILHSGDIVKILLTDSKTLEPNSELNVPVAYEDSDVIVFNKPVFMPVHPSIKHQGDTLGNYFAYLLPDCTFRPINRLDRDTSGLCVVAKNAHSARLLQQSLDKTYYAVLCGELLKDGRIDAPIAREEESIIKRMVHSDGQTAITDYTIVKSGKSYTLVRVKLLTGRTHQIRVHFSHIGYPLAGDDMYGGNTKDACVQALHCKEISFVSPSTEDRIYLTSDLREDMIKLLDF